jgi:hypothetical protein
MVMGLALTRGYVMASWGSFALGFLAGLLLGEVTLVFFLALVRRDSAVGAVESPPLTPDHETPAPTTSGGSEPAHSQT